MIADVGSLAYRIPSGSIRLPDKYSTQPEIVDPKTLLPRAEEDLAIVDQWTSNYYDLYGKLKTFTEEMATKYQIDVTKPDFSKPGGGDLYKTYKKLENALRWTANALKQQKSDRAAYDKLVAANEGEYVGFDPSKNLFAERNINDIFTSTELLPEVEEMIRRSQTTTHTPDDWKSLDKDRTEFITHLESLRNNNNSPARKKFYQNQIDALLTIKPYTIPYAAFQNRGGSGMKDPSTLLNLTKPVVIAQMGGFDPSQVTYKKRGNQVVAQTDWGLAGKPFGKVEIPKRDARGVIPGEFRQVTRTIKGVEMNPNGEVYLTFNDTDDGIPIDPQRIDNQPTTVLVSRIIESMGGVGAAQKALQGLYELGIVDDLGINLDPTHKQMFGNRAGVMGENKQKVLAQLQLHNETLQETNKYVSSQLDSAPAGGYFGTKGGEPVTMILYKNGETVEIKVAKGSGGTNFYVKSNADKLGLETNKAYTKDQVMKAISDADFVYTGFLDQPTTTPTEQGGVFDPTKY